MSQNKAYAPLLTKSFPWVPRIWWGDVQFKTSHYNKQTTLRYQLHKDHWQIFVFWFNFRIHDACFVNSSFERESTFQRKWHQFNIWVFASKKYTPKNCDDCSFLVNCWLDRWALQFQKFPYQFDGMDTSECVSLGP